MSNHEQPRQRQLPFDGTKEQQRLERAERVERLLGSIPKIDRASAPQFDYQAASKLARGQK